MSYESGALLFFVSFSLFYVSLEMKSLGCAVGESGGEQRRPSRVGRETETRRRETSARNTAGAAASGGDSTEQREFRRIVQMTQSL